MAVNVARVVGPKDGDFGGSVDVLADRFMLDGERSGGRLALVEHIVGPRILAAPVHRHSREDEYSYVLEGRVGLLLGDEEIVAEAGDLVVKPRDEWHTFWNATDGPLRILEMITPAGLEKLFREFAESGKEYDMEALPGQAARFGCELDLEATMKLVERHGLAF